MAIRNLASLKRELFGKSVVSCLNRQRAFSASPFERRSSPSLKRSVSSRAPGDLGCAWDESRIGAKSKRRRKKVTPSPLVFLRILRGNVANLGEIPVGFIEVNAVADDKQVFDFLPYVVGIHRDLSPCFLVQQRNDLH